MLANNDKYVVRVSLTEYLSKLSMSFIRTHRSYIVNIDHLKQLNQHTINVGTEIPIGKVQRDELMNWLNKG